MSEVEGYTPSVEDVRAGYAMSQAGDGSITDPFADMADSAIDFDRWLASERARIWDECAQAWTDAMWSTEDPPANPYKEGK